MTPSEGQLNANVGAAALRVAKNADDRSLSTRRDLDKHVEEQGLFNDGVLGELKKIRTMLEGQWFNRPWVRFAVKSAAESLKLGVYFAAVYFALKK